MAHEWRWYQLDQQHEELSLAGKKVTVRTLRNGTVQLEHGGKKLQTKELRARPVRQPEPRATKATPSKEWKPAADHP